MLLLELQLTLIRARKVWEWGPAGNEVVAVGLWEKKASLLLCPLAVQWETTNKMCAQFRQSYKFGLVGTKQQLIQAFTAEV